jgi:hypothetical protein
MSTTYNPGQRRRATVRTWLALGAAAVVVVVLVVLIAVACAARTSADPAAQGPSPTATGSGSGSGSGSQGSADGDDTPDPGEGGSAGPGDGDPSDDGDAGTGDDGDGGPGPGAGLPALTGYELVRRDVAVAAGDFLREAVACPAGTVALGGGAQVVGAGNAEFGVVIQESAPGSTGGGSPTSLWLVSIRNTGGVTRTVGMFVACAHPPAGYDAVRLDVTLPAGGYARDVAVCPAGAVVLGGGVQVIGAGSGNFGTVLQESRPGPQGGNAHWLVSIRNPTATTRTVGIRAVCADPLAGYEIVNDNATVAAGNYRRAVAVCPPGTVVTGGGAGVLGAGSGDFLTVIRESTPGVVGAPEQSIWLVSIRNDGAVEREVGLRAVCAKAD